MDRIPSFGEQVLPSLETHCSEDIPLDGEIIPFSDEWWAATKRVFSQITEKEI